MRGPATILLASPRDGWTVGVVPAEVVVGTPPEEVLVVEEEPVGTEPEPEAEDERW
jgi:hypothetical protein